MVLYDILQSVVVNLKKSCYYVHTQTQMAKLADAPGLGSGEFFMQVQVLFCVLFIFFLYFSFLFHEKYP